MKDAVSQADVILLAVGYKDAAEALKAAGNLTSKVVIDISNPITADFKELTIGHSTSAAEELQKLAPGAKVVKAFNTIFAEFLPTESRKGRKVQVFIAGDDETAKAKVSDLVKTAEFEPIDCGTLYNSRFLEPMGEIEYFARLLTGLGHLWSTGIPKKLVPALTSPCFVSRPCETTLETSAPGTKRTWRPTRFASAFDPSRSSHLICC